MFSDDWCSVKRAITFTCSSQHGLEPSLVGHHAKSDQVATWELSLTKVFDSLIVGKKVQRKVLTALEYATKLEISNLKTLKDTWKVLTWRLFLHFVTVYNDSHSQVSTSPVSGDENFCFFSLLPNFQEPFFI